MCGIFGSFDGKKYKSLFKKNKQRGTFAYGSLNLYKNKYSICKMPGVENVDLLLNDPDIIMRLGHTQAPTSIQREWSYDTSHPFHNEDWIVMHNGVLTNYIEVANLWGIYDEIKVDTQIIPLLLSAIEKAVPQKILPSKIVAAALTQLDGTFAVIIHSIKARQTFLARQGSTLFANILTCDFSSVPMKGVDKELKEGVVYQITNEGLTQVDTFNNSSPFFVL